MSSASMPTPVLEGEVIAYLASRGFDAGVGATVTPLADGVSARVYLVESSAVRWVVKQALPELLVETQWRADPARALTEARAIQLLHVITPEHVPQLVDIDAVACVTTMTAAPASMVNWRQLLLAPHTTPGGIVETATILGSVLGRWHHETAGSASVARDFDDDETFELLRIEPFHRTVSRQHPSRQHAIGACIDELMSLRECFIHGDFSPKNVLVSDEATWVLDFEVARMGAAVFDLAFLGHHFALKAIARPHLSAAMTDSWQAFLLSYRNVFDGAPRFDQLGWHIACLLLARVDGVSRARYLTDAQANDARAIALRALGSTDASAEAFWTILVPENVNP